MSDISTQTQDEGESAKCEMCNAYEIKLQELIETIANKNVIMESQQDDDYRF